MDEKVYRQSRLCRLLGNPISFAVVDALSQTKELSPSEIARAVGRSVSRVSHVLASLRLAEVVRYDTDGRQARYRLNIPGNSGTSQGTGNVYRFVFGVSVTFADLRN
jgi:DNA-binding transcriptional ArsR family regulator